MKLSYIGQFVGSFIGMCLSFIPASPNFFPADIRTIPSMVQIVICILGMSLYAFQFSPQAISRGGNNPLLTSLVQKEVAAIMARGKKNEESLTYEASSINRAT